LNVTVDGDLTLNGGTGAGTRIGQPAGLVGGGDIVVTTGGNLVIAGTGTTAGAIRTTGDVTLHADNPGKAITQVASSTIQANTLTATAHGAINLAGTNRITNLSLSSANAGVAFSSAQSIRIDASSFDTAPGTQTVAVTTTGPADITVSGTSASDDDIVLVSGRDIIIGGGSTIGANSATVSGGGALQLANGVVTLNAPVNALMRVNISGATVNFNGAFTANSGLTLSSGALQGSGPATIASGAFVWSGGTVTGSGLLTTQTATSIQGPATLSGRTWANTGIVNLEGAGRLTLASSAVVDNRAAGVWNVSSTDTTPVVGSGSFSNAGIFNNDGATAHTIGIPFENAGTLNVNAGRLTLARFPINAGRLNVASDATFATGGAPLDNTGTIGGNGTIDMAGATLTNNGNVSPGSSPGDLTILGDYTQTPSGVLTIEVAGTNPGTDYDVLNVTGNATLGGTLNIVPITGYQPPPQQNYDVVTYNSHSGNFDSVNSGYTASPQRSSYGVVAPGTAAPGTAAPGSAPSHASEAALAMPSNETVALNDQTMNTTSTSTSQEATQAQHDDKVADKEQRKEVTRECR
jgi:hypothetical protein